MAKKKSGRGGARVGAGRKPAYPGEGLVITVTVSVPGSLMARLDALADEQGWTRSESVTRAIRGLLGTRKRVAKD
jgi:Ribbon-helix-helix protein, copG family